MTGGKRTFVVGLLRRPAHDDDNFAFDVDVSKVLVSSALGVDRVPAKNDLARELTAAAERTNVVVLFEL